MSFPVLIILRPVVGVEVEDGEETATATALAAAKERLNTTKKYVFLPFRKAEEVIERASDAIANFFSTLGPHVVLALGSLVFRIGQLV